MNRFALGVVQKQCDIQYWFVNISNMYIRKIMENDQEQSNT